jgi:hypothetical protein
MACNVRHRFESRTARLKLAVHKKPYSGPAYFTGVRWNLAICLPPPVA